MAIPLVEIVNPTTGRKGRVAATSRAAQAYRRPPSSQRADIKGQLPDDAPNRGASTQTWQSYGTDHGLSPDQAEAMTRDDLVAHFTITES